MPHTFFKGIFSDRMQLFDVYIVKYCLANQIEKNCSTQT